MEKSGALHFSNDTYSDFLGCVIRLPISNLRRAFNTDYIRVPNDRCYTVQFYVVKD